MILKNVIILTDAATWCNIRGNNFSHHYFHWKDCRTWCEGHDIMMVFWHILLCLLWFENCSRTNFDRCSALVWNNSLKSLSCNRYHSLFFKMLKFYVKQAGILAEVCWQIVFSCIMVIVGSSVFAAWPIQGNESQGTSASPAETLTVLFVICGLWVTVVHFY